MPNAEELRRDILQKAHKTKYTVHPGGTKMYQDMKHHYWWKQMKVDVAEYVAKCQTCQVVKAEHSKLVGVLHPLFIPKLKWESISMDFILRFPLCQDKDWIWVIVDRLTKSAHFIPVKGTTTAS